MNDFKLCQRSSLVESCSTSLPGGDQVDGLPPAASISHIQKILENSSEKWCEALSVIFVSGVAFGWILGFPR